MQKAKKKKSKMGGVREGAGRPRVMDSMFRLCVTIDEYQVDAMDSKAEEEGKTRSEVLRDILKRWVARQNI